MAIIRHYPDSGVLSYEQTGSLVQHLSGVIPIKRDMCIDSVGFTGPYTCLENCPSCGENHYQTEGNQSSKWKPRNQFMTIPLAPQLQALRHTIASSTNMNYRTQFTEKILGEIRANRGAPQSTYSDFFVGSAYLDAVQQEIPGTNEVHIKSHNTCLLLSVDGAQLSQVGNQDFLIKKMY